LDLRNFASFIITKTLIPALFYDWVILYISRDSEKERNGNVFRAIGTKGYLGKGGGTQRKVCPRDTGVTDTVRQCGS
jgi:hypothetical protein